MLICGIKNALHTATAIVAIKSTTRYRTIQRTRYKAILLNSLTKKPTNLTNYNEKAIFVTNITISPACHSEATAEGISFR